jgi:hypothetical protein
MESAPFLCGMVLFQHLHYTTSGGRFPLLLLGLKALLRGVLGELKTTEINFEKL